MNLPGFGADTSLYKTSNHYCMIRNFGRASESNKPSALVKRICRNLTALL